MTDKNTTPTADRRLLPTTNCSPFLIVDARVRYWDDGEVNGVSDSEEGDLIPLKEGDSWKPIIDLATGIIQNWPADKYADIHYKVCDDGDYWLGDADGTKRMKWRGSYVPDAFLCMGDRGYGDYIILNVNCDGQIAEWSFPVIDFEEWESLENDERMHPYQRGRASISGLVFELRKNIETGRLVGVVMARLVRPVFLPGGIQEHSATAQSALERIPDDSIPIPVLHNTGRRQ